MADETAKVVLEGVPPYDGEYDLDTERAFNAREWHWIKKVAGYMPRTIREGFRGGDPDLWVALAVIALARAGKIDRSEGLAVADLLAEQPFEMDGGAITLVFPDEDDDSPLELTDEPELLSQTGSPDKPTSSGPNSTTSSAPSDKTPSSTGISESDTSARLSVLKASVS